MKDEKGVMKDMAKETKGVKVADDVMTNQWVDDVLRAKRSGSYFVSFTNGKHQIDAMSAPYFRGVNTEGAREQANGILVFEDGRLIYGVGSDLVDNEYQTYTQGKFRSDDALWTYLVDKYRGEDFRYTENVVEETKVDAQKVYDNREYQAKLERERLLAELDAQKLGKSVKNLSSAPGVNVYDEKGHVMDGREILEKHGIEFLRECCSQIDKSYLENIISDINPVANNRADYMDDRNLVRRYDVNLGAQYLSDMGDTYESVRHANGLYMNFVGKDVNPEDVCAVAAQVYCMVENGADSKSIDYLWDKGIVDNLDVNAMRWYRHSFENAGYDNTLWMEDVVPENRRELVDAYIRDCAFDEQVVRSISAMSSDYVARTNVDRFRKSFEKKTDWVNQMREMKFANADFASYSNGEHQIDAMSSPFIVDGGDRKSGIAVYEDGRPLYVTGSELIDGHYEPYTMGEFHTEEGVAAYLMEKYRGKDFEKIGNSPDAQLAHVDMFADKVYQNSERQSAYEAEMKNLEMSRVSNDKDAVVQALRDSVKGMRVVSDANMYDSKGRILDGRDVLREYGVESLKNSCKWIEMSHFEGVEPVVAEDVVNSRLYFMDENNMICMYDENLGAQFLSGMTGASHDAKYVDLLDSYLDYGHDKSNLCMMAAQAYCMVENGIVDDKSVDLMLSNKMPGMANLYAMRWFRRSFEDAGYEATDYMNSTIPESYREVIGDYVRDCGYDLQKVEKISLAEDVATARVSADVLRESYQKDAGVDLVEDLPAAAASESKLPKWIQSVLDARSMNPVDVAFSNGEHQIDASGYAVESGYEFFTSGLSIYEDGKPLFVMDSDCVDNYHFESYTLGQFHSIEDVTAYLVERYGDQSFEPVAEQKTAVLGDYKKVYDNPSYQRKYDAQLNSTEEELLDRVVFKSQGRVKGRNGVMYNRVDFAYACDNKRWGIDEPMANPYLNTSKQKMPDGKLVTNHSYYLSDAIYNCLTSHANSTGMENSKWDGVIAAKVMYPTDRNGKQKLSVDLTRDAVSRGDVRTPKVPFDELKHDKFVKLSMAEVHKKREEMAARQLPEVGEAQTGAELSCDK